MSKEEIKEKFHFKDKKCRNKKSRIPFKIKIKEWYSFFEKEDYFCFFCKKNILDVRKITVDRVDCFSGYYINNIVICCAKCNQRKSRLEDKMHKTSSIPCILSDLDYFRDHDLIRSI